ncbi:MAG: VOC family protein [Sphingomonadales bacterium]|nr:VOC family protein [Sphingomonadales bacterium]
MIRNVNRIDHVAGVVRRENLEPVMERMSEIFAARFHGPYDRPAMRARVAMSLDAGIELLAPADDDPENPFNQMLSAKGEHWLSVVMGVRDMDATCDHLARLGYKPMMRKSALGGTDQYPDKLTRLEQAVYAPGMFGGLSLSFCCSEEAGGSE